MAMALSKYNKKPLATSWLYQLAIAIEGVVAIAASLSGKDLKS